MTLKKKSIWHHLRKTFNSPSPKNSENILNIQNEIEEKYFFSTSFYFFNQDKVSITFQWDPCRFMKFVDTKIFLIVGIDVNNEFFSFQLKFT